MAEYITLGSGLFLSSCSSMELTAGENVSSRRIINGFLLFPYTLCLFIRFWDKSFVYFNLYISYTPHGETKHIVARIFGV
jgi:hypothetical protein